MTDGEKMVWAAYYGANYRNAISNTPLLFDSHDARLKWEDDQIASVIEGATYAVRRMREMKKRVGEGWGEEHDTYQMLCEMLEE